MRRRRNVTWAEGRVGRLLVGAALAVAMAAVGSSVPAGGGAPPPPGPTVVGIAQSLAFGPHVSLYRDCDGVDQPYAEEGAFLLERSGDILGPLTVPLSWSGDMVPFLDAPSATATFEAGEASTTVTIRLTTPEPGPLSLVVTVEDGPDHDPGAPSPGYGPSVDLGSDAPDVRWDCGSPMAIADELADQTIEVGEVPAPLGLPFVANPPRDAPSPEQLYTEVVSGEVPPGLTYQDDTWGGAATTPGEYAFEAAICTIPGTWLAPISVCVGRVAVAITVVDPSAAPPSSTGAPTAPAATPDQRVGRAHRLTPPAPGRGHGGRIRWGASGGVRLTSPSCRRSPATTSPTWPAWPGWS